MNTLTQQINQAAQAARNEGQYVKIDTSFPSIDINGEYSFQEWQVDELLELNPVPEGVDLQNWLLYIVQSW